MRLIIAGGRDFDDYRLMTDALAELYEKLEGCGRGCCYDYVWKIDEIVSGGAKGADYLGEKFAKLNDIHVRTFHAEWDTHGKSAGIIRNRQMADYADEALVFWDGFSKGSLNMIQEMILRGKPVWVRGYKSKKIKLARPHVSKR